MNPKATRRRVTPTNVRREDRRIHALSHAFLIPVLSSGYFWTVVTGTVAQEVSKRARYLIHNSIHASGFNIGFCIVKVAI